VPPGWEVKDRLVQFVEVDQRFVPQQSFVPYACVRSSFIGSARGSVLRREEWFVKPPPSLFVRDRQGRIKGGGHGDYAMAKASTYQLYVETEYLPNFRCTGFSDVGRTALPSCSIIYVYTLRFNRMENLSPRGAIDDLMKCILEMT